MNTYRNKPLLALLPLLIYACSVNNSPDPSNPEEIEEFLIGAYKKNFDLKVTHPAFVYSSQYKRYTSTAYHNNKLYRIYVHDDGRVSSQITTPDFPKGNIKVLSIIVNYPDLKFEDLKDTFWAEAQESINLDHETWANKLKLDGPIVQFSNINLLIDVGRIIEPTTSNLQTVAAENNYSRNQYDVIAFIDLNQNEPSGGFAVRKDDWVKMGWFYGDDDGKDLTSEKLRGIAYGVYHHEIGHLWGWDHEWSDAKEGDTFITDPELFGWEDIDNNGIVEILDPNPYGIK